MRIPFRQWLSHRFVFVCEVLGYAIIAVVGIGIVYGLLARVEVVASATGPVEPPTVDVVAESECLVTECLVVRGAAVEKGTPIARVVEDPEAQRVTQASVKLHEALALLEQGSKSESQAVAQVRGALSELTVPEAITLTAPAAGRLKQEHNTGPGTPCPSGGVIARLYDLSQLTMQGTVESRSAEKVVVGNLCRLTLPEGAEVPEGTVEAVKKEGKTAKVTLRWKEVPLAVQDLYAAALFGDGKGAVIESARADIVVGHESLFRRTFGRRSQ